MSADVVDFVGWPGWSLGVLEPNDEGKVKMLQLSHATSATVTEARGFRSDGPNPALVSSGTARSAGNRLTVNAQIGAA